MIADSLRNEPIGSFNTSRYPCKSCWTCVKVNYFSSFISFPCIIWMMTLFCLLVIVVIRTISLTLCDEPVTQRKTTSLPLHANFICSFSKSHWIGLKNKDLSYLIPRTMSYPSKSKIKKSTKNNIFCNFKGTCEHFPGLTSLSPKAVTSNWLEICMLSHF